MPLPALGNTDLENTGLGNTDLENTDLIWWIHYFKVCILSMNISFTLRNFDEFPVVTIL